jgi:hypothetical protein
MTARLWSSVVPLSLCTWLAACGSDRVLPDVGARPDAGFFTPADVGPRPDARDAGPVTQPDADPMNPDADPMGNPDADPMGNPDADPMGNPDAVVAPDVVAPDAQLDAGSLDAVTDATPAPDAVTFPDAAAPDAQADAGFAPDAVTFPDAAPDAGFAPDAVTFPDAAAPDAATPDGGTVTQGGGVLISEFVARSATLEWIEIHNTTAQAVNLANYTVSTLSRAGVGAQPIRATNDLAGTFGTAVNIPAGGMLVGVANPAVGNIPAAARFVIGGPGALGADWLADGGDVITLRSPGGAGDVVDYRQAATNPAVAIGATQYPLVNEASTHLDPTLVGAGGELGNDNGAVWCADTFRGPTPNAANRACNAHVISEFTYDYGSPTGGADDGYEFVEVAGPAGGSLSGVFIGFIEGTGATAGGANGTSIALSGTRMPLDGLYVVADRSPGLMTSFVANVDQAEEIGSGSNSSMENGPDALQLYRQNVGGTFTLLDAVAYGVVTATNDTTRQLAMVEGTPTADPTATVYPANFARSDDESDTNDNATDFAYLPTPTPGARNGSSAFTVTSITPADALVGTTATITLAGTNFTDQMTVVFAQTPSPTLTNQTVTTSNQLSVRVVYPAAGPRTAERVNVTLNGRAEFGRTFTVTAGFTWTTAANESNAVGECDFCNLQFPLTFTVAPGATSPIVYGRIFEAGRTNTTVGGPAPNILAELGYGAAGTDPRARNWTWTRATFNVESGNDDEYRATLVAPAAGTYAYTYRYSLDGGLTWSYADADGAGSNAGLTFSAAQIGLMTVQ